MSVVDGFKGFDYAVGTVAGIRRWRVDSYGRLVGVTYKQVWTPGENVATCRGSHTKLREGYKRQRSLSPSWSIGSISFGPDYDFFDPDGKAVAESQATEPTPCPGIAACPQGFWAYYDDPEYGEGEKNTVVGMIEGYGQTIVGPKGFRSEKAKITALCVPRKGPRLSEALFSWWGFGAATLLALAVLVASALTSFPPLSGVGFGILAGLAVIIQIHMRERRDHPVAATSVDADLLARNYPDVPVYRSEKAMRKAHPIPPAPRLDPQTDPDFWTREAAS